MRFAENPESSHEPVPEPDASSAEFADAGDLAGVDAGRFQRQFTLNPEESLGVHAYHTSADRPTEGHLKGPLPVTEEFQDALEESRERRKKLYKKDTKMYPFHKPLPHE